MTSINKSITHVKKHPARTGVFAVVAVIAAGMVAGAVFGFDNPLRSFAAPGGPIVVTAPVPLPVFVPPVVPIVLPTIPTPIVPVVTPDPTPSRPDDVVITGTTDTDTATPAPTTPTPTPTPDITVVGNTDTSPDKDIVVTAPDQAPEVNLPPCCTLPNNDTSVSTPPTSDIVVVAQPQTPDTNLPPCCTALPTTSVPPVAPPEIIVVAQPQTPDTNLPPCCTTVSPPTTPPVFLPTDIVVNPPTSPDTNLPPCCTVVTPPIVTTPPIITTPPTVVVPPVVVPPVVVPPVVVPPVIVVPPVAARCIAFTATPQTIAPGDAVTLAWETENATAVSINNGIGNVSTRGVGAGSYVVNPTTDTTYVLTVTGATGNIDCQAPVKVVTRPVTQVPACVQLTANDEYLEKGESVILSWVTNNASSISIDNGVGTVTPVASGSVTVTPTANTTYTATVPGAAANDRCKVSIDVHVPGTPQPPDNPTGGGGGGHHHHSSKPNVVLSSSSRLAPPLGSVYLSDIPYTGLDLGPVGTTLYWLVLILWSLAAAYLVLFGMFPMLGRKFATFGANVGDALNGDSHEPLKQLPSPSHGFAHARPELSVAAYTPASTAHAAIHAAAVAHAAPQVERPAPLIAPSKARMNGEGFRAFATADALTIDDIVKGLSRESGMVFSTEPSHEAPAPEAAPATQHEAPAAPAPAPHARESAPAPKAASVHAEVPGFIASILAGERDHVFGLIRQMNQAGHDVEDFMAQSICALDDAYRARIDGTPVHADVKQVTDHCATPFLEKLVTSLTTAVDGSYSMGVTGIKLALTRALAVAQG